jgi:hypothetical protein
MACEGEACAGRSVGEGGGTRDSGADTGARGLAGMMDAAPLHWFGLDVAFAAFEGGLGGGEACGGDAHG